MSLLPRLLKQTCASRGKIDLADRPARCLHHYSHASVASMLGKILHFKFPQSYYMGGDANTLNWAINAAVLQAVHGGNVNECYLGSHILYMYKCQKGREIVICFLCFMKLCRFLVSIEQNSPFRTEKGGVFATFGQRPGPNMHSWLCLFPQC